MHLIFQDSKPEKYSLDGGLKIDDLKKETGENNYCFLSAISSSKVERQINKTTETLINSSIQQIYLEIEENINPLVEQCTSGLTVSKQGHKSTPEKVSLRPSEPLTESNTKEADAQAVNVNEEISNHSKNDSKKVDASQCPVDSILSKYSFCQSKIFKNPSKTTYLSNILNCENCGASFVSPSELNKHNETKCVQLALYSCKVCYKSFTSKDSFRCHFNQKHSAEGRTFKCALCDKEYTTKNPLIKHLDRVHYGKVEVKLPQKCELCQKAFASRKTLISHINRQHGKVRFECWHCSKKTRTKEQLRTHIQIYHMTSGYKCTQCSEDFKSASALSTHKSSQHQLPPRTKSSHLCELCGKNFKKYCSLKLHLLTHSDSRRFVCHVCGKGFNTPSNLDQHMWTHSNFRPFTCDLCEKSFRIRNHLRQHLAVHGMVNTSWKGRRGVKKSNTTSDTLVE